MLLLLATASLAAADSGAGSEDSRGVNVEIDNEGGNTNAYNVHLGECWDLKSAVYIL